MGQILTGQYLEGLGVLEQVDDDGDARREQQQADADDGPHVGRHGAVARVARHALQVQLSFEVIHQPETILIISMQNTKSTSTSIG